MMKKNITSLFSLAFLLLLSLSSSGWASVQGRIEGVVTDSQGNPLQGVKVTITSLKVSARKFELTTNKEGRFTQVGLWPGYYRVTFRKSGYMTVSQEIKVKIAEPAKMEIRLEKATEILERNVSKADKLFLKGNKLYEQQQYEEAVEAYKEALQISPSEWGYYFNLALAYKKLGRKQEATESFQKAVELNPESYSSNKELGEALAKDGDYEEAKKYYLKATEISPDDPDAFYNLGVCLTNLGESEEALRLFLKTVELNKDYAEAYYQIGTLYISQNRVEEAVHNLEKFLELAPQHEKAPIAKQLLQYLKK